MTALPVRPAHLLQTLSAEQRWLIEGLWGAEAVGIVGGEPKCCLCRARHKQHSFAVSTLIRWYRSGADVDCEVPKLATYLGHNSPKEVYWYLQAVPELLKLATERSCRTSSAGAP